MMPRHREHDARLLLAFAAGPRPARADARLNAASAHAPACHSDTLAASKSLALATPSPSASASCYSSPVTPHPPSHNCQRHYPHSARHHRANLSRGFLP